MNCEIDSASIGPFVRQALIRQWCARADSSNVVPFRVDVSVKLRPEHGQSRGPSGTLVLFPGVRRERKA